MISLGRGIVGRNVRRARRRIARGCVSLFQVEKENVLWFLENLKKRERFVITVGPW